MRYNEIRIRVAKADMEMLEAVLIENGWASMMIDDPDDALDILEHPDIYRYDYINEEILKEPDRKPEVTLYFADDAEGRRQMAEAEALLADLNCENSVSGTPEGGVRSGCCGAGGIGSEGDAAFRIEVSRRDLGDDSEWLYKWQEHFKPTKVGDCIVVRPGWEDYEAKDGELVIEMDPGMAFGSGLHETTSMCIKALEKLLKPDSGSEQPEGDSPSGESLSEFRSGLISAAAEEHAPGVNGIEVKPVVRVLDVGTGTGILGIASILLGADECLGIDIDPDAVRVANENIEKNCLKDKMTAQYGDLTEGVDYLPDIVVANLMADLVVRLTPAAARHLKYGGYYITSGILDIKEELCREAIEKAGFTVEEILSDGEWRAIVARRQPLTCCRNAGTRDIESKEERS